ncbi:hypothetical protein, partial [Nostoc sp. NMS8]|uniref:hypothetical protein n=1 Tax=Nostoc sp. NMS8 TaxID=2815392 RepID=UPI0025D92061
LHGKSTVFMLSNISPTVSLSLTITAWCQYLTSQDKQGQPIPIDDPLADILTQRASLQRFPLLCNTIFSLSLS